jgi:hypothetical protein
LTPSPAHGHHQKGVGGDADKAFLMGAVDVPASRAVTENLMKVTIYGASDDLIEVEGDIEEEFNPPEDGEPTFLAFSDGTILRVEYGAKESAFWRITPVWKGSATYSKTEATNEDDDYSDRVTLEGTFKWVVCGSHWAKGVKR